jgi:hypothetical protein
MPRRISTVAPPVRSDFRKPRTTIIGASPPIAFNAPSATAGVFKIVSPHINYQMIRPPQTAQRSAQRKSTRNPAKITQRRTH